VAEITEVHKIAKMLHEHQSRYFMLCVLGTGKTWSE